MDPPLRERLRWRNATDNGVERPATTATMARTAALLSSAIALTSLVAVLVPGDAQLDDDILLATAAAAGVLSVVLLLLENSLTSSGLHAVAVLGTVLSSTAAYGWGSASAYGPLPYVWVSLFVFYFFSRSAALVHLVVMAAGYALVLVEESPSENALDGWIATVATLLVTGYLISAARDWLRRLVAGLSDAAHRDSLTGLLNRRGFQELMEIEIERALRSSRPLAIVVGDLDHFKHLNDRFGHAAGDLALKRFAEIASQASRRIDAVARIGG